MVRTRAVAPAESSTVESKVETTAVTSTEDKGTTDKPDNEELEKIEEEEEEITMEKTIYYLNAKPLRSAGDFKVVHWSEVSNEKYFHHASENLTSIGDDKKILSPLHECRFYSLEAGDKKQYVEVIVDEDFVLSKLSNFLATYTTNAEEASELVFKAGKVAEKIRLMQLKADIKANAAKYGLTVDELMKVMQG